MRGLSQSKRANMPRMGEANKIGHQSMRRMLTEGCVDWQGFGRQLAREANALLGGADAALIFDGSGFARKGGASAGVARQWNGRLGKADNCQAGVFATLCRGGMATLTDAGPVCRRIGATVTDVARKPRSRRINGCFKVKHSWPLAMLKIARQRGVQFGHVGIDGGCGKEPAFLRGVDGQGRRFVADVHCGQTVYLQDPGPLVPGRSGRGRRPPHRKPQSAAQRVDRWAAARPADAWQRLTLREDEKGLLVADYLHAHVWVWDGEEEQARCWHPLVRRDAGAGNISHYCLSNAPPDTPWQELARAQAQRFFIGHSFREAKSECGMADYQARRWDAWHNHMAWVMPGTLFLVKQKKAGRQQWPMLSFNDLVTALGHPLPRRQLTAEELADIINKRRYLRQKAKGSHARSSQVAREWI